MEGKECMCQNWSGSVWVSASLVAQMVKYLPAMRETQVRFLDQEDPLEKGMATHSSTLAWKIPPMEKPGRYSPWDFPGKNTGVGCHYILQGIFLVQGSNPGLPHCRQILYHLSHQGSPVTILF